MSIRTSPAIAAAVLAACAIAGSSAFAQNTNVRVYGVLDIGAGSFKNPGAASNKQVASSLLTGSHIGFAGEEDLGGGMAATFQLESFLQVDTGAAARTIPNDTFWSRNSNVGVKGSFGHVRLGRATTPVFVATIAFNPLTDSFSFSPATRALFGATGKVGGDTGWNNAVTYTSPRLGAATVNLQYSLKESAAGSNLGGNVMYFKGPLALVLAASDVRVPYATGKETTLLAGATYDFGPVKLYGHLGRVKEGATGRPTANSTDDIMHVSLRAPIGTWAIIAGYAQAKTKGALSSKREFTTLGVDYFLSKRTDIYLMTHTDKLARTGTGNATAIGIKHVF